MSDTERAIERARLGIADGNDWAMLLREHDRLKAELARAEDHLARLESWRDKQGYFHDLLNPECEVQSIIDERERRRDGRSVVVQVLIYRRVGSWTDLILHAYI